MSSAAGPMVPLRTGSEAWWPVAGSVSSKLFSVIEAAGVREFRARYPSGGAPGRWSGDGACSAGSALLRRGRPCSAVLAAELVDAARGVDDLLLAGIERVAV